VRSWVTSANDPACDFPIQNLPYGVFTHHGATRIGVAIGDSVLDLRACAATAPFASLPDDLLAACRTDSLNALMTLGPAAWSELRRRIVALLDATNPGASTIAAFAQVLVPMREATMRLPARIGNYTDFYASIHHATRVGTLFRPGEPLLPNYKYVPIGYHGRASSIVVSGTPIHRPSGQTKLQGATAPTFGPTRSLDYEIEVGLFIGPGNTLGQPIPIATAEDHIFGLCLLNDWSTRDIQSWEYQPLGPFLAKSFATTISPWIVPLEALAPYRVAAPERPAGDPAPLPYLTAPSVLAAFDLTLEVFLQSAQMRKSNTAPMQLSRANLRDLYWTLAHLVTHHASNGCNLRPGDLLATGTISGPDTGSEGCLLEKQNTFDAVRLPTGELRTFLEAGDQVTFRAFSRSPGLPRIGFGECTGVILS
jgi:fumarylacetoacetase